MSFSDKNNFDLKFDQDIQIYDLEAIGQFFAGKKISSLSQKATANTRQNISADSDNSEEADINTKEKENVKAIEQYQEYQQDTQGNTPWASSSDIRVVDSDRLPDPNPIMETDGCPECGNIEAYWWIVQTDSGDEPSAQFFRCTKCNHTWRTPKSSL